MPLRISNKWRQTSLGLFGKDFNFFFPQHIVTANSTRPRPRDKSASLDKTPSGASLASILFSHCLFSINVARGSIRLVRAGRGLERASVTFLSGDFMANTGIWQASSGHPSGAIVLSSLSPHDHPGEFSSPGTRSRRRKLFIFFSTVALLCVVGLFRSSVYWQRESPPWKSLARL